ncbi:MAG TPA: UDP-N-acetylmuramate--L-alanine ligase, partial [bacterium]|nr:UDP-N-acetylmuramate--L-alanine ligase [bacterium]
MSGIAELLLNLGYKVTGSDLAATEVTERLARMGGEVALGHAAANVKDADVLVYSSAVKPDNPEMIFAHARGIPVIPRAEMLSELMRMKYGIAVGGAHGKTTTTWLVGLVMAAAGLDPTIVVGGRLKALGTNAKLGSGRYLVAEADESDGSFLRLSPTIAIVTNIDEEHLDHYRDLDAIKAAFVEFVNKVPFYGSAIVCLDQENVQAIIPKITRRIVTYGFSQQADIRGTEVSQDDAGVTFNVTMRGRKLGSLYVRIPGEHNVSNALAAVAVASELDIPFTAASEGISAFTGISRRLEHKGEAGGIVVMDDYAHHPTEIMATLKAARSVWRKRVVAVFQPHRHTRTNALWERLGRSFYDADCVVVTSIYGAGEEPIPGVTAELVAKAAVAGGHRDVTFIPDRSKVIEHLAGILRPGDLLITLGAGDVWKVGEEMLRRLSRE